MHPLDATILLAFVVYALAAGLRARRVASRSLEEYFLAGRTLRGWQAGVSMAATQFAADTPLVVTGLVATAGLFSLWQLWSYGLAFLMLGFLFAPSWRRARVLTDAEFAELRYSGRGATILRGVRAFLFGVVFNCVVVAMVLFAATLFAEVFLTWNEWLPAWLFDPVRELVRTVGVPLTGHALEGDALWTASASNLISIAAMTGLALAYSATGGLRSVVTTDVMQLAIMLGATALFTVFAVAHAGGLTAVREELGARGLTHLFALSPGAARNGSAGLVAVFALQWLLQRNADGSGYLAQRVMACRSDADARQASVIFAFVQIGLRSLLWVPLALALLAAFPPAEGLAGQALVRDREASFVLGMRELLPVGALGLMLTAMLAALTSTIDTHLNWGASYLASDLYARLWCEGVRGREPSPRAQVWVARMSTVLLLAISLVVMTQLSSIQSAWKLTLVLGAGMGVVTVLRWLWWRITAWGELAALAVSFLGSPIAVRFADGEAIQMLGMGAAASAAAVAVSLLGPSTDPHTLRSFAERVKPPGWWGALAPGSRARLARALAATVASATTLFAGLVAALRVLAPAPGEGAGLAELGLVVLAVAAVPFWWPPLSPRSAE
jgi:SSS family solute:Na+ symporter